MEELEGRRSRRTAGKMTIENYTGVDTQPRAYVAGLNMEIS
jgi:hypothetical protein